MNVCFDVRRRLLIHMHHHFEKAGMLSTAQRQTANDGFAHTIANDEPHELNAPFSLDRFVNGSLIVEHGAAAVAH